MSQPRQPTISRFFQKKPCAKIVSEASRQANIIKARDAEINKQNEEALLKQNQINSQRRTAEYGYNKSSSYSEPTGYQLETHERYKRKLNQISFVQSETNANCSKELGSESEADMENPLPKKQKKTAKLTPLDQQVKDLKLENMDKVLAVQVGYKYKFYCEDAVKVHKILNIMLIPGKINIVNETPSDLMYNKLAYCSIPEPRLHIHLQRLLDAGLKVAIANQTESQIVKSVEGNSSGSGLFKRVVSHVFTKATYMEFGEKDSIIKNNRKLDSIIAIYEVESDFITLVSIQPLTGEIIYDEFRDDFMRNEFQTRLSHLEPLEFLYFEGNLSKSTLSIINQVKLKNSSVREVQLDASSESNYATYLDAYIDDSVVEFMISKSSEFRLCCSILIEYLKEFELDTSFKILSNYTPFIQSNHMLLNSNSLENLEIFENATNGEDYGSLIWILDHTRTRFGFRQLKNWISKPLISRELIEERLDSIEELQTNFNHFLETLSGVLKNSHDLEKILSRIHYGKVKRKELYIFVNKLGDLEKCIIKFGKYESLDHIKSVLLKRIMKSMIDGLLEFKALDHLKMINAQYALDESNDNHTLKYFNLNNLNISQDEIIQQTLAIEQLETQLDEELKQIRTFLKRPSLEYVEKSREPYLIEIRNGLVKMVPKDWIKINATKSVSRFRSPKTTELYKKIQYHQELYYQACNSIFKRFIAKIDDSYMILNTIIKSLSTFDCLLSLATASAQPGYSRPKFVDSRLIDLKRCQNPILRSINVSNYVSNDIFMDKDSSHLIITGPNMGGKSSIVKQIALIQIMAQIGCFVPAESATLSVLNTILTRMGAQDDLIKGESTFYTEMSQVFKILKDLKNSNGNSLVILDEIGRGTGTIDGISIASAILEYLLSNSDGNNDNLVLFITHFPSLCNLASKYQNLKNYHMSYIEELIPNTSWPKVTFLYELTKGVSNNSYGLNVAKLAGINDNILAKAWEVSQNYKSRVELNRNIKFSMKFGQMLTMFERSCSDCSLTSKLIDELSDLIDEV